MAILLPTLQRVRNQARAVVCQANLKQWGTTLALYVEDNRGRLPCGYFDQRSLLRGLFRSEDDPNERLFDSLNPVDTKGIACCPMAVRVRPSERGTWGSFEAWEIRGLGPPYRGSYGLNSRMFSLRGFGYESFARFRGPRRFGSSGFINVFSVKDRAKVPVLLDCKRPSGSASNFRGPPPTERSLAYWGSFCMNRHNGHINGLFLDWSVRNIGLKELWTLNWYREFDTSNPWTKAGGVLPEDWPQWMRSFKDY